jgi:lysozyme
LCISHSLFHIKDGKCIKNGSKEEIVNPANKLLIGAIGASLIASVSLWEGTKYVPYDDVVGVVTVCQGYTGKEIVRGRTYTPAECKAFLTKELLVASQAVLKCVNVPLTRYQYDAYVLFAYNVGTSAFCNSNTVLKPLNVGNYKASCDGLLKWVYADGKVIKGLYNRRVYERQMCLGELNVKT